MFTDASFMGSIKEPSINGFKIMRKIVITMMLANLGTTHSTIHNADRDVVFIYNFPCQMKTPYTNIEMSNQLNMVSTSSSQTIMTAEILTFSASGIPQISEIGIGNFGTEVFSTAENSPINIPPDIYGALTLRTGTTPQLFTAEVLRIRELTGGKVDFVMPTVVQ